MSEQAEIAEVREKVERSLQRALPDSVWDDLIEQGYVGDCLPGAPGPDTPEQSWRELKDVAEKRLRLADRVLSEALGGKWEMRRMLTEEREKPKEKLETSSFIGPRTAAMVKAMSKFFALLADQHPEVKEFRAEVLGERFPLSPDEAHALIASYATRVLPLETFAHWGIPVVGHRAEILDRPGGEEFSPLDDWVTIWVDPPGFTKTVRYAYTREGDLHTWCMSRNGEVVPIITGLPINPRGDYVYPSWLWPGSIVDELYNLSVELAHAFDWLESAMDTLGRPRNEAAAWFVLTGEAPEVRPLDGRWELKTSKYFPPQWRMRRIHLAIPPWVPAEEVSQAYRLLRGQAPKGRELPKTTTPLEVASFVWEQERLDGYQEPRPWSAFFKRWKEEYPESKIKTYNNFRTIFFRGVAAVKELNFDLPQPDE